IGLTVSYDLGGVFRVHLPKEPRRDELDISSVLYALSDQIQLDIVRQLSDVESLPCGEFKDRQAKVIFVLSLPRPKRIRRCLYPPRRHRSVEHPSTRKS